MAAMVNPQPLAWAFNARAWEPSAQEMDELIQFVQAEEQERIRRFRFEIDRKRALAGRVMIRKMIQQVFKTSNEEIKLGRTDRGKPFLVSPDPGVFNFNLSHHGSWVVLVAHSDRTVGVDVMEYELPKGNQTISSFFSIMVDSFTPKEWSFIRGGTAESAQTLENLKRFYKLWSLKESYIKALGIGIGFGLQRASFSLQAHGRALLELDGQLDNVFEFAIQELDNTHCVGIAVEQQQLKEPSNSSSCFPLKWKYVESLSTMD